MDIVIKYFPSFLSALKETIKLALVSGIIAILIGFLVAILHQLKIKVLDFILNLYTAIFRSTPLLVQLYIFYFGFSLIGINIPPFTSAVIAFSLNTGAYVSEIVRGGLESIDKGQFQASSAMGMTFIQTIKYIIVPQVLQIVLPSLITQFSYLIKDTSLATVLVIKELTYSYRSISSVTYRPFESLIVPMIFYFILYCIFRIMSSMAVKKGAS